MATPTRTDKVVTRSMTAKLNIQQKRSEATQFIIGSHQRDGCTEVGWRPIFHNGNCYDDDDDDEYHAPCRCCIAQLFRKEGRDNPCNVACRICFNWKGALPGTQEFYTE